MNGLRFKGEKGCEAHLGLRSTPRRSSRFKDCLILTFDFEKEFEKDLKLGRGGQGMGYQRGLVPQNIILVLVGKSWVGCSLWGVPGQTDCYQTGCYQTGCYQTDFTNYGCCALCPLE
jgi:hypothetical protein